MGVDRRDSEGPSKGPGRGQAARGAEARRKVLELRVAGVTFETIGRQLGISKQAAHKHYQRAIAEEKTATGDLVGEERELTRRRLDAVVSAHWMARAKPQSGAIIIKAERERIRLLGLGAPLRFTGTLDVEVTDARERLLAKISAQLGPGGAGKGDQKPE